MDSHWRKEAVRRVLNWQRLRWCISTRLDSECTLQADHLDFCVRPHAQISATCWYRPGLDSRTEILRKAHRWPCPSNRLYLKPGRSLQSMSVSSCSACDTDAMNQLGPSRQTLSKSSSIGHPLSENQPWAVCWQRELRKILSLPGLSGYWWWSSALIGSAALASRTVSDGHSTIAVSWACEPLRSWPKRFHFSLCTTICLSCARTALRSSFCLARMHACLCPSKWSFQHPFSFLLKSTKASAIFSKIYN